MQTVKTLSQLHENIANVADDDLSSIGLVVVAKPWDKNAMALLGAALKLCDVAVVLYLPKEPMTERLLNIMQSMGVRLLFQPQNRQETPCRVEMVAEKLDVTLLLQTVLAVMPISVFVDEKEISLRKCFQDILSTFQHLFTLRHHNLGEDVLTLSQKAVRDLGSGMAKAIKRGRFLEHLQNALPEGGVVHEYKCFDVNTLEPIAQPKVPMCLFVKANVFGESVSEVFEIKDKKWNFLEIS